MHNLPYCGNDNLNLMFVQNVTVQLLNEYDIFILEYFSYVFL